MNDCLFCKIAARQIKSKIISEGDRWLAFEDINPQAPQHVLIIPKKHITSLALANKDELADLLSAADRISEELKIKSSGFRVILNQGKDAGQIVPHLHFHLLGGRPLNWPPG